MTKYTPSIAKNLIRRSLRTIVDPYPSEKEINSLWKYFEDKCAYCGTTLIKSERNAHIDHLVSSFQEGSNNIYNFVLACGFCNGDEEREKDWEEFLKEKCKDEELFKIRKLKIEDWKSRVLKNTRHSSPKDMMITEIIDEAVIQYEASVEKLRRIKEEYT